MKKLKHLLISIIDRLYFTKTLKIPAGIIKKLYYFVCSVFEQEAIDCYYADKQDIGFFESFILGSDETKKISNETSDIMKEMKKADLMEKLAGYVPPPHITQSQSEEVMRGMIQEKKVMVVNILRGKGEIIRYLGRRIITRSEKFYSRLEKLYNKLYNDLQRSMGQGHGGENPPE